MFPGTQTNLESKLLDSDSIVVSRRGQNFVLHTVQGKTNMVLANPFKAAVLNTVDKSDKQQLVQRITKDCGKFVFHSLLS